MFLNQENIILSNNCVHLFSIILNYYKNNLNKFIKIYSNVYNSLKLIKIF